MPAIPLKRYLKVFEPCLEPGEQCSFACRVSRGSAGEPAGDASRGAEWTTTLAAEVPTARMLIGFTDRRLIFVRDFVGADRGRGGEVLWSVDLARVSDAKASKAKINKPGTLALTFADGSASELTLPGPDSRDLVRFLESRNT